MQESKKQRFATLTNDEYATLSTLLQERESINIGGAIDMAVRTFRSYINDKALNLNLCFKFYSRAIFVFVNNQTIVDYGGIEYDVYSPENINIDLGCRLGQY